MLKGFLLFLELTGYPPSQFWEKKNKYLELFINFLFLKKNNLEKTHVKCARSFWNIKEFQRN